jgi:ElaB/YqjD/DUF883 family membrane-anchored ribosome-binding protein
MQNVPNPTFPEGPAPAAGDRHSSTVSQAEAKTSGLGQAAADTINESRGAAAEGLDRAGSALHEKADSLPGGEKVANAAHTTADALGSTADYLRKNDSKGMMQDVQKLVKNNPGPALLTAAMLGFLLARIFSRD